MVGWHWMEISFNFESNRLKINFEIKIELPWEFGSGRLSRGTKCITVVLPNGKLNAPNVTLQCKNLPWYINRSTSAFGTASAVQSIRFKKKNEDKNS